MQSTQLKLDQLWSRHEPSSSKVPPLSKIPEGKVRSFIAAEKSIFESICRLAILG